MSAGLFIPTVFAVIAVVLGFVFVNGPETAFSKGLTLASLYWCLTMIVYGAAYAFGLVS